MNRTYEDGVRDGELHALKARVDNQDARLNSHEKRLRILERISWLLFGGIALVKFFPELANFLKVLQ